MQQRSIIGSSKTGSISRSQARRAAKAVKMAKPKAIAPGKSTSSKGGKFVSASVIDRYLGPFGAAPSNNRRKNESRADKSATTKSTAKNVLSE
jgi:hypothetical protein